MVRPSNANAAVAEHLEGGGRIACKEKPSHYEQHALLQRVVVVVVVVITVQEATRQPTRDVRRFVTAVLRRCLSAAEGGRNTDYTRGAVEIILAQKKKKRTNKLIKKKECRRVWTLFGGTAVEPQAQG